MKYFKHHYENTDHEWTDYGCYETSDITPEGYIHATVYSADCEDGNYSYECYDNYFDPDEIIEITEEENKHVIEQLQKVDALKLQIDEIISKLI